VNRILYNVSITHQRCGTLHCANEKFVPRRGSRSLDFRGLGSSDGLCKASDRFYLTEARSVYNV
jgi:hypothetical protein